MSDHLSETTTVKLLDAWKTKRQITSDNAAAIALGIKRQTISSWRHGRSHANPATADTMASDLGLDALRVLAAIEADRAYTGEDRRVWQKHGRSAFMALLLGLSVGLPPGAAKAELSRMGSSPVQMTPEIRPLCEMAYGGAGLVDKALAVVPERPCPRR